jgi:hypothetical protein
MTESASPQVFVNNPVPSEALAMAAHTLAVTTATEMRLHREDCSKRDEANRQMFTEIRQTNVEIAKDLKEMGEETNKKHVENIQRLADQDVRNERAFGDLKIKMAMIVGGFMALIEVAKVVIPMVHL